jgi:four helix bundle protein
MEQKIRTFTDLTAWRESHRLVLLIYKTTNQFPQKELFSLVDQMRRCGVSVSSNIAEGGLALWQT